MGRFRLVFFHSFAPFFVLFSKIVTSPASPTNELDLELMNIIAKFLHDRLAEAQVEDSEQEEPNEEDGIVRFLAVINAFIKFAKSFMKRDRERVLRTEAETRKDQEMTKDSSATLHDSRDIPTG